MKNKKLMTKFIVFILIVFLLPSCKTNNVSRDVSSDLDISSDSSKNKSSDESNVKTKEIDSPIDFGSPKVKVNGDKFNIKLNFKRRTDEKQEGATFWKDGEKIYLKFSLNPSFESGGGLAVTPVEKIDTGKPGEDTHILKLEEGMFPKEYEISIDESTKYLSTEEKRTLIEDKEPYFIIYMYDPHGSLFWTVNYFLKKNI